MEWTNRGGEWVGWRPISDERRIEVSCYELADPGICEIILNVYRGRDFVRQLICVKVRLTVGRAKQRAVKLTETLADIV